MLIQMLLDLQGQFRWLPEEMLAELSRQAKVPLARIYRIVTFYEAFSLAPRGSTSSVCALGQRVRSVEPLLWLEWQRNC